MILSVKLMLQCFLFDLLFLDNLGAAIIELAFKPRCSRNSLCNSWFSHQNIGVWLFLKIRLEGLNLQCGLNKTGLWHTRNDCIQIINHVLIFGVVNPHILKDLQHELFPFLNQCIATCGISCFTKRVLACYFSDTEFRREPRTLMRGEKKSILLFWFKWTIEGYQQCQ